MSVIAVTGATGHLGGLVVEDMVRRGHPLEQIVPLVRSKEKGRAFAERGMSPRVASYDDREAFGAALAGIDKLVLISPPALDNAERLDLLHGAVMEAAGANLSQLAYVSLADPEERPFQLEDVDLAIEHSIRATGVPFTILRDSVYADELAPELAAAAASGKLLSLTGSQTLNWAPRPDMARAIAGAVTSEGHLGKTYNLVSAAPYTYDDIAAWLSEALGKEIQHLEAPADDIVKSLEATGMDPDHARSMVHDFQAAIAAGKCRTTGPDIMDLGGVSGMPTPEFLGHLATHAAEAKGQAKYA